jgi:hypothetical protein
MGPGGRGATGAHGAAGGASGRGREEDEARRKAMAFEDEDAWLDDEETGPGVIA